MDPKGERIIKSNNTIIEEAMNVVSTKSDIAICKKTQTHGSGSQLKKRITL